VRPAARACEASLRRLGTDRLDQYLLRWLGPVPLAENVEGVPRPAGGWADQELGVSNFDVGDMEELL
jgi:diketogulonate reductase-like aldo/keto reductase